MADSATGRRFSRSPGLIEARTGASSVSRSVSRGPARVERRGRTRAPDAARSCARRAPIESTRDDLAAGSRAARQDRNRAFAEDELAGFLEGAPLRVSELVQPVDELPVVHRLPAPDLQRTGQHAREHAVALAVQPLIDEPGEADVVIRGRDAQPRGVDAMMRSR